MKPSRLTVVCGIALAVACLGQNGFGGGPHDRRGRAQVAAGADKEKREKAKPAAEPDKDAAPDDLNDLGQDIAALQSMDQLKLTRDQLRALRAVANSTSGTAGDRKEAKASDGVRQTMIALRKAYLESDDKLLDALNDKLNALLDAEDGANSFDYAVELTDAAKTAAPTFFKDLGPRQVAGFLAALGDGVPDPLDRLSKAIDTARTVQGEEWQDLREQVPEEIGRLVAGFDHHPAGKVSDQVFDLLQKARGLSDAEFKADRPKLEAEARKIVAAAASTEILRHAVEHAVAELMSNPRLPVVLDARLRQMDKQQTAKKEKKPR